jgi:FkbM family methyltransferase
MMTITDRGWAVIKGDTHLAKWVAETGLIDHNQNYGARYYENGLRAGDTAIDVGACIGDTTVPMAEVVGHEGKVFAFEPNPMAFACLVYNTRLYPQVKCYPYALSHEYGTIALKLNANVGASHIVDKGDLLAISVTLDSFGLNGVRFIKMDVEGFELNVIRGGWKTISLCRPRMMIETAVHGERFDTDSRRKLYAKLEELAYTVTPHFLSMEEAPQYDIYAIPAVISTTNECPA